MPARVASDVSSEILPGRACGTCTLCCKVLGITALEKPQGSWCPHCKPGSGCGIYPARPTECAAFLCGYLSWKALGEHWKPAKSKIVVALERSGGVALYVDTSHPGAWRADPYYREIKRMAALAAADGRQVVVMVGRRATVVLPASEVDLGIVADDEVIVTGEKTIAGRAELSAFKVKRDDPRAPRQDAG